MFVTFTQPRSPGLYGSSSRLANDPLEPVAAHGDALFEIRDTIDRVAKLAAPLYAD